MFQEALTIGDWTGGINSKLRPSKIAINEMRSIVGMDFVANNLARAKGYTKFGTESEDTLTGKTLYKHTILAGVDVLVKTIGTTIKFYDSVDDAWYKMTDATLTTALRWSFASFNSYLYGNNGTDAWLYWTGSARSTTQGDLTVASTTIDLGTGHGARFPASGTIMVRDQAIAYTGVSTDQLTGVTGITGNISAGATVILKADTTTYTGLSKIKQGKNSLVFFKNRLYMIDKTTPTIIRHSKLADNTNPETDLVNFTIAASGSGDAGFGIAPEEIVSIFPIVNGSSSFLGAFCKDGNVYSFIVTDSTSSTVNAFVIIRTMTTYPYANQMVCAAENDIAITDNLGHIRTLGYGDINTPLQVKTISSKIEPSLELLDFSNGCMRYHKRVLYTIGKTSVASTNNKAMNHDANYSSWSSYSHWDVVDLDVYEDELYGLSSITGNVWKLNDGYEANSGDYYSETVTGDMEFGAPLKYKQSLKMRVGGLITTNCEAYYDVYLDNEAVPTTFLISGNNANIVVSPDPAVAVGEIIFGTGVFGGGLESGTDKKSFAAQIQFKVLKPFFSLTIRIRIDGKNVDHELLDLVIYAQLCGENLWKRASVINRTS